MNQSRHISESLSEAKKEVREAAQDFLMQGMADSLSVASDRRAPQQVIAEMKNIATRIGKKFGFENWPGIY